MPGEEKRSKRTLMETEKKDVKTNPLYICQSLMSGKEADQSLRKYVQLFFDSADFQRKKLPSRCATVCLGLLCVVLLAGNIGQVVYYEIIGRLASADPAQASTSAALTAERKELEARLSNQTKEKDLLQQSYTSATAERDEFNASLGNLKKERDQLQASYTALKQESDELQTSYNNTQKKLEVLKTEHNNLTASKDQLQTIYSNLQREKDELQTLFVTLTKNRDQLQSSYSSLKREKEQLQKSYDTLRVGKDLLQTSYNSLWKGKEQLQTSYNNLRREKEQLQANYSSASLVRDQLEKKINKLRSTPCQSGWKKFDISCYWVSTLKKNWTLSRQDCKEKGADLIVINSREEQIFVNTLLKLNQNAWIGLTDSLEEGTWMWVDGTPVTMTYWQPNQPNSFNGNQDCGEFVPKSPGLGEWNDDGCFAQQVWICEK
ncbi:hypothetical protein L3Q82_020284 [Scortum barcoo]|uniref:Uncharacterized protein n=1 Tax=Scortum barcoo TaxID=214431 RepID=A0ACB8V7J8_9TELE|nr:hypothetical protein L3Q82_020284 [Scortum barcoo]